MTILNLSIVSKIYEGGSSLHCYDYARLDGTQFEKSRKWVSSPTLFSGVCAVSSGELLEPEEHISIQGPDHAKALIKALESYLEHV